MAVTAVSTQDRSVEGAGVGCGAGDGDGDGAGAGDWPGGHSDGGQDGQIIVFGSLPFLSPGLLDLPFFDLRPFLSPGLLDFPFFDLRPFLSPGLLDFPFFTLRPFLSPGLLNFPFLALRPFLSPGLLYFPFFGLLMPASRISREIVFPSVRLTSSSSSVARTKTRSARRPRNAKQILLMSLELRTWRAEP